MKTLVSQSNPQRFATYSRISFMLKSMGMEGPLHTGGVSNDLNLRYSCWKTSVRNINTGRRICKWKLIAKYGTNLSCSCRQELEYMPYEAQ